jgi:hypothetical protein
MGVGGQLHALAILPPGGWVGSRAGLDGCEKISPPNGVRYSDCPAHSESLYWLRYPGPHLNIVVAFSWDKMILLRWLYYQNVVFIKKTELYRSEGGIHRSVDSIGYYGLLWTWYCTFRFHICWWNFVICRVTAVLIDCSNRCSVILTQ